jgi:ATP-dependent DNA helicase RecG
MESKQLEQIIQQGEGLRVEFKEATDSVPASFYETVVSFSNTDGGTLLLGVNDNGIVRGVNPQAVAKLQKDIITALNARDCVNLPLYVPGALPVFCENDTFVTKIPLQYLTMSMLLNKWIHWLELKGNVEEHLSEGLKSIALPASLIKASWEEVLLYLVPSWHRKGTQLAELKWPDNQVFEKDKIEKVPSWSQKSTQLLRKKTWYLIGILSLCTEPVKLKMLLEFFDYRNEKAFRDNYIKPLREVGFIVMTIPNRATDPENKYVITEQGKAFLSGQL